MQSATPILQEQTKLLPFYITRTAIDYIEYGICREYGFDEYQIMQCTDGVGQFNCQSKSYTIYPNDIVVFAPHIPHEYHRHINSTTSWKVDWLCFLINGDNSLINQLTDYGHFVISSHEALNLSNEFHTIVSILQSDSIYNQMQASVTLYKIITEIVAQKQGFYKELLTKQTFAPVISYMKQHLTDPISIDELSDIAEVSTSFLCRKFKEIYQVTPIKYLINLRMTKARELLTLQNKYTVKEVSKQCGYIDVSYFCSEFKRYYRLSPSEFRNRFYK